MTIPELIALRRPEPVEIYTTAELVPIPFEEIRAQSHLLVEGTVRLLKTYLGDDQCSLYTDFEVVAPVAIAGTLPLPEGSWA